jgi:hypothetical protein
VAAASRGDVFFTSGGVACAGADHFALLTHHFGWRSILRSIVESVRVAIVCGVAFNIT